MIDFMWCIFWLVVFLRAFRSSVRKPTPWFSSIVEQFCELKRERRQAERRWLQSKLTIHKQIYDSIKQKVTNFVDKAKQAYYAKIQSSTACKQLFQNFNTILGKSRSSPLQHLTPTTFRMSFLITSLRKSAPSETIFLLQTQLLALIPLSLEISNFWACHWWICFLNNQQYICQVLWTWSHSHHASLWKPWHPLADHHEHHQHISYHWHCTVWSEDSHCQTSVEKAITWQTSFEKLPSHF